MQYVFYLGKTSSNKDLGEIDLFSAKLVQKIRDIQGLAIDAKDKKHSVLGEIKTEQ